MYCLNCGKKIDKRQKLDKCPKCGEPIEKKTTKTNTSKKNTSKTVKTNKPVVKKVENNRNNNVLLILIIGILILMCIGTIGIVILGAVRNNIGTGNVPEEYLAKVKSVKWRNYTIDVPNYEDVNVTNASVVVNGESIVYIITVTNIDYAELKDDQDVFEEAMNTINNDSKELVSSEIVTINSREYVTATSKNEEYNYYYYFTTSNEVSGTLGILVKTSKKVVKEDINNTVENIVLSIKNSTTIADRSIMDDDVSYSGKVFEAINK